MNIDTRLMLVEASRRLKVVANLINDLVVQKKLSSLRGRSFEVAVIGAKDAVNMLLKTDRKDLLVHRLGRLIDQLKGLRADLENFEFEAIGYEIGSVRELLRDIRGPLMVKTDAA